MQKPAGTKSIGTKKSAVPLATRELPSNGGTGGMNMCNRPDFEGEEAELDQELVALMRHWRRYSLMWVEAEDLDGPAWVEQFIQDMQRRAEELREQAELPSDK